MVTIPGQFNGPADSGNGGWVCGLVAEEWQRVHGVGPVEATLHQPPPLASTLAWEHDAGDLRLVSAGGALIATARAGVLAPGDPPHVTAAEAERGRASYAGFDHHPFERCFTCGPRREEGDGLRLFAGPIADGVVATPWQAHPAFDTGDGAISTPVAWAAIDCTGGLAAGFPHPTMVLGRMTGVVRRRPAIGEALIATGWLREIDGRKRHTGTALSTLDGEIVAHSTQVWITVADAPAPTPARSG